MARRRHAAAGLGDVVDLAGHRTRPATPIAIAAVVATTAASRTTGADLPMAVATTGSDLVRGSAGRWVRHAAAGWLRRAGRRIRPGELEAERL